MTLGIGVVGSFGVTLVADSRRSQGWKVISDDDQKVFQIDRYTGVIHAGLVVDSLPALLQRAHEGAPRDKWELYLGYIAAYLFDSVHSRLHGRDIVILLFGAYRADTGPVLGTIEVLEDTVKVSSFHMVVPGRVRFNAIGELDVYNTQCGGGHGWFDTVSTTWEVIEASKAVMECVRKAQEVRGSPLTVGGKIQSAEITSSGFRWISGPERDTITL